jgi:thiol-disulfide isomerase/thioredoxin
MRHLIRGALALTALVAFAGILTQPTALAGDQNLVGKPAPALKGVFALNGQPQSLADLKGKVVLIDFWAVWCGPCKAVFPHLRDLHEKYGKKGLVIVGVTTYYEKFGFDKTTNKLTAGANLSKDQEQDMLKDFVETNRLPYTIWTVTKDDWKAAVNQDYGVKGIPTAVLIDQNGVVRLIKVGSGPANAQAIEKQIEELLEKK